MTDCPNFVNQYRTLIKDYIQPAQAEWLVYHALPFINFRLTNIQCAIGLGQLQNVNETIYHRKRIAFEYDKHFNDNVNVGT